MKTFDAAWTLVLVATLVSACRGRDTETPPSAVGSAVSPLVPTIDSELATFRAGMTVQPHSLTGPPSQDSLVRLFERALAKRDTAGLDQLQISREEFAYLYYPDSKMARPPYELGPELMWMQIQSQRDRGLRRLVAAYGGRDFRIRELVCQPPQRENAVVIHQCGVRPEGAVRSTARQLFGSIIERDGRFKFVGYANPL